MKVLLDVDGVLADFVGGVCKFYDRENPYQYPENKGVYDIVKLLEMEPLTFWKPLGYQFWKDLEKLPYADSIVEMVTDTYGEENICILTKPCDTVGCADGKVAWVKEHYPQFNYLIGSSKSWCAYPDSILFDDHWPNVRRFREKTGLAFLMPGAWNQKHGQHPTEELQKFLQHKKAVLDACT